MSSARTSTPAGWLTPDADQGPPSAVGEIAGMTVVGELGRGTDTVVYRVRRGSEDYALKVLDAPRTDTQRMLRQFRREAALLAGVDHPGLPRIHEVGQHGTMPYLVMDLVDGLSLAQVRLRLDAAMPPDQVVALAADITGALVAVHRTGLIHRDIKPDNIIVLPSGEARLIDFGLATQQAGDQPDLAVGTLAYAAPEQAGTLKRPMDRRSDLYSLGVVLYAMTTAVLPFPSSDVGELLRMHAVVTPPDPATVVDGVGSGLAAVIMKLLAKDPDDRYASGEQLLADLAVLSADPAADLVPGMGAVDPVRRVPLVGRALEIEELRARWQRAEQGHGGVCLIRGTGGAGKSRLAAELAAVAADQGALVLHGKSSPDDVVPLAPLRAAVDGHLRSLANLPEAQRDEAYQLLRSAAGSAAALLGALSPALGHLLSATALPDEDRHDLFQAAVVNFLAGLARLGGGLVLILDDVQWLDTGTRRLLQQLSAELKDLPLLLLATARDDAASAAATDAFESALGETVDVRQSLTALSDGDVAQMVAVRLPGIDVGPKLGRLLNLRGQGNPFVVNEYLRAVVDAGLLRPSWGRWLLDEADLDALELPQDAIGLVLARVRGLGADSRRMLTAAAVAGTRFRQDLIARVCGLERTYTADLLVEAAGHALVEERDPGWYTFLHDRIREALLAELDETGTAELNQRIAEVLDDVSAHESAETYALAQHYVNGLGTPPERIVAACLAAGRLALDDHAPDRAIGFLTHAELFGAPLDAAFLQTFGMALTRDGRHAEARDRFDAALTMETDPLRRGDLFILLASAYKANWDTDNALLSVEHGLAEVGSRWHRNSVILALSVMWLLIASAFVTVTGIGAGRAAGRTRERLSRVCQLHEVGAYVCIIGLHPERMVMHGLCSLHAAVRLGPSPQYVRALGSLGMTLGAMRLGGFARRVFAPALREAERIGDPRLVADVVSQAGAAAFLGAADDGQTWEAALLAHGRWVEQGHYADSMTAVTWELISTGRTAEGLVWFDRGQARVLAQDRDALTAFVGANSVALTAQSRFTEAMAEFDRVNDLLDEHGGGRGLRITSIVVEVYSLAEQGDFGARFDELVTRFHEFGIRPLTMIRPHRTFAIYEATGRVAQCRSATAEQRADRLHVARAAVRRLRRLTNTPFLTAYERILRADLALLEGRVRRARRILAGVQQVRRDAPMIAFEAARVLARALQMSGHTEDALRQARLAQTIAIEARWPHRERWIMTEFGLGAATGSAHSAGPSVMAVGENVYRQRLAALEELGNAAARVLDPDALARIALDEIIRILAADRAFLFLAAAEATSDDADLVGYLGRDGAGQDIDTPTAYSATLVERVRTTGEPLVVAGTSDGEADLSKSVVLHGLRSIMAAPIQLDGRLMGVVYLDSRVAKGIFTPDDVGILTALTNHIATSFATARAAQLEVSVQAARQQRDVAETLHQALTQLSREHDPQRVLVQLLDAAAQIVACDDAWLLVRRPEGVRLVGLPAADPNRRGRQVPADPTVDALLDAPGPVLGGATAIPAILAEELGAAGSWLALPLVDRNTGVGVLVLAAADTDVYDEAKVQLGTALAVQGVTAYANATLFAQVQALATIDELTQIPNRRAFFDVAGTALAASRSTGQPITAIMIDIDHFKRVNDTHGHSVGDEVIRTVAARLSRTLRPGDTVGRYGGEEFAVLLPDTDETDAAPLAETLRAVIADAAFDTAAGALPVTLSLGVTQLHADDDIGTMLARADEALYRAKTGGRNQVCAG